jgi:SnoaL-like domain
MPMPDLIALYDRLVIALRGGDDAEVHALFHPDFQVHEDFGLPYGGTFDGADGFIALRHKVRTYWGIEILSKCPAPEGDRMVIVLKMTGLPGGPLAGMETLVCVVWTFAGQKATEAKVLYFDTPAISAALAGARQAQ